MSSSSHRHHRPPVPPPVITSAEGVTPSGDAESGFSLTPDGEGGSIVYRRRTIDISVTRDEGVPSDSNPAVIIPRDILDRVQSITFHLSEASSQDSPSGFRVGGLVAEIELGVTLSEGETMTVCLPSSGDEGEGLYHYDEVSGKWELLPSRLQEVNGENLLCGETDDFSRFGVLIPVIESAEGVLYSESADNGYSLTPVGAGGTIVYGDRTIGLSVTGDVDSSSGNPAVIVSRSILNRVEEEITFELSEVSPHDPPSGLHLSGFVAEVNLGVALGEEETVTVCLPSAGGDIYRYNDGSGDWELLSSLSQRVNGKDVVCAEAGRSFPDRGFRRGSGGRVRYSFGERGRDSRVAGSCI